VTASIACVLLLWPAPGWRTTDGPQIIPPGSATGTLEGPGHSSDDSAYSFSHPAIRDRHV